MTMIILILAITGALAIAGLALLAIVIAGIHASERHMNLNRSPEASTEKIARRILGAGR
jgi:hypothetical protein